VNGCSHTRVLRELNSFFFLLFSCVPFRLLSAFKFRSGGGLIAGCRIWLRPFRWPEPERAEMKRGGGAERVESVMDLPSIPPPSLSFYFLCLMCPYPLQRANKEKTHDIVYVCVCVLFGRLFQRQLIEYLFFSLFQKL